MVKNDIYPVTVLWCKPRHIWEILDTFFTPDNCVKAKDLIQVTDVKLSPWGNISSRGKDPVHKKGHQILYEVVAETGIEI